MALTVQNLYIIDSGGQVKFSRAYSGEVLDSSLLAGFFSSLTSFVSALVGQGLRAVKLDGSHFVVRSFAGHHVVARAEEALLEQIVGRLVDDVVAMLTLLFGMPERWDAALELVGYEDVVDRVVRLEAHLPSALVGGISRVQMAPASREQLDRMLVALEDEGRIVSSALFLGGNLIHSRLPTLETRLVTTLLNTRPQGLAALRHFPVFVGGKWASLVLVRMRALTLAVLATIDAPDRTVEEAVAKFGDTLHDSGLQLPGEAPPVLLRHFSGRDVIGFIYFNKRTGIVIAPSPRPFNPAEEREINDVLWWLYSRAAFLSGADKTPQILLEHDGLWFHSLLVGTHSIFVLYSGQVNADAIDAKTRELLQNVIRAAS